MPNEAAVKTVETIARAHAELFVRGPVLVHFRFEASFDSVSRLVHAMAPELACAMRAIDRPGALAKKPAPV